MAERGGEEGMKEQMKQVQQMRQMKWSQLSLIRGISWRIVGLREQFRGLG